MFLFSIDNALEIDGDGRPADLDSLIAEAPGATKRARERARVTMGRQSCFVELPTPCCRCVLDACASKK